MSKPSFFQWYGEPEAPKLMDDFEDVDATEADVRDEFQTAKAKRRDFTLALDLTV